MEKLLPESIKTLVVMMMITLILPFVINCFFAYPQTDDFCYSFISRNMGFLKSQHHVYVTWSGRFTSTALLSINPLVYQSVAGYKLVFVIFIFAFFASIYILTSTLTKNTLSCKEKLIFALILLFAYFDQMDDIRSGLYWMAGVITYQVAETFLISYIALLFLIDQNYSSLLHKCVAIIFALLLCGTNEIVMALVVVITLLFILVNYTFKKIIDPFLITMFTALAIGSCIVFLAPGTFARLSEYHERKSLIITVWSSLNRAVNSIEVWITSPLTLVLMGIILFAIIGKPQLGNLFSGFKILYSVSLLFFLTLLCFFIPFWSTGRPPENRVLNMIYFFFLIGWLLNMAIIFSHYSKFLLQLMKKIPIKTGCVVVAAYIICLFSLERSNFMLVSKDLLSGDSYRYNEQMLQRENEVINSEKDDPILENITVTPDSLYFYFIAPYRNHWVNGCYATYFGKKSVALAKNMNCKPLN